MKQLINKIIGSLDTTTKNSFSARKLTAFVIVLCVIAAHVKWISLGDFKQLEMVLTIDYGFLSVLFGLATYSNIKEKNETPINNN